MAQETFSEKLVKKSNSYYLKTKRARITRNEPRTRLTGNRLIFSGSLGLDYSGLDSNGKYVSFELKETHQGRLPMSGIRENQLDIMESEYSFGGRTFLLVYFHKFEEWFRLNWPEIKKVIDLGCRSIPIRYFRAFGSYIHCTDGFPLYLDPFVHKMREQLKVGFPDWMPKPPKKRPVEKSPSYDVTDMKERERRIKNAMTRGCKNAERKNIRVEIYKQIKLQEKFEEK